MGSFLGKFLGCQCWLSGECALSKKLASKGIIEDDGLPKILPPKNDFVFKALFGDKRNVNTLIAFLDVVLKKKIKKIDFCDPINKQRSEADKLSILDVKVELDDGEIVNVEMQSRYFKDMRKRITHYSCELITDQLGSGDDYGMIKPVISVAVVKKSLIKESRKCHNVFSMLEEEEKFEFNGLQKIHILDLSRIKTEKNETLADWLTFIDSEKEEDFMKVAKKNEAINLAFEELKALSNNKEQRMLYQARLRMLRDGRAELKDEFEKGEKRGIQKGKAEGITEGMQKVFLLIDQGYTPAQAKKMLKINTSATV